ncbi:MAG: cation transporter [Planctomycetes bacterium]|nr:cation transporter [Planctomycetota bacterium]
MTTDTIGNQKKIRVARLSILSNTLLVVGKLVVGIMSGSVSVISEAIHSGIDLLAAIIAYFSVRAAAVPPDKEHQFGHGKIENLSGYIEATLIFFAAALIIHESIDKIIRKPPIEFIWLGLLVMAVSVVLNRYVSRKLMAVAKEYHSAALEADALHLTTDVYTSLGVMAGLGLVHLTGLRIIDPLAAIVVAILIIIAAYRLTRKSVRDLVDIKLTDEEEKAVKDILEQHTTEFVNYHKMRTRRAGNTRFIDLHLVVNKKLTVDDGHRLTEHLELDLLGAFQGAQVLIHIEPCDEKCPACSKKADCATATTGK